MELGDLLLRLAQCEGRGEGFGHALARHSSGQTKLRIVTRIVRLGAMAGGFTAAAHYSGDRTGSHVAQTKELFEKLGAIRFQGIKGFRHGGFLSERYYTFRNVTHKRKPPKYTAFKSRTQRWTFGANAG